MMGAGISEALQFGLLSKVKKAMCEAKGVQKLEKKDLMICAMMTGVANSFLLNPIEVVKIQMQLIKKFESD